MTCIQLTSTEYSVALAPGVRYTVPTYVPADARRRGTAAIEMVFCASTMLVVFFLVWSAMEIHRARQEVVEQAHARAFSAATAGRFGQAGGGLLSGGTITRSDPSIVKPTLGSFRPSGNFPLISSLPNEAYVGSGLMRVEAFAGEPHRWVRGNARYRVTISTGPPWTFYGSERTQTKHYYELMLDYGIRDVFQPLGLAPDSISSRLR